MHIKHLHFLEHIEIPEFTECEWNYPCPSLPAVEDELHGRSAPLLWRQELSRETA